MYEVQKRLWSLINRELLFAFPIQVKENIVWVIK